MIGPTTLLACLAVLFVAIAVAITRRQRRWLAVAISAAAIDVSVGLTVARATGGHTRVTSAAVAIGALCLIGVAAWLALVGLVREVRMESPGALRIDLAARQRAEADDPDHDHDVT